MSNCSIFISRALAINSPFGKLLTQQNITITALSLIELKAVSFAAFPRADWLFFYSKNGVKYFFEGLKQPISWPPIATIGKGTAAFLAEQYALKADWVGNGNPQEVAKALEPIALNKTVLFVQAQQSKQSVQKLLENKIKARSLVVYDNQIKANFELGYFEILVFTSPLNVQAYFEKYTYQKGQKIVCIGKSTAAKVHSFAIKNYYIAAEPSEKALALLCLELIAKMV